MQSPEQTKSWVPGGERTVFLLAFALATWGAYVTVRPVLVVLLLAGAIASLTTGLHRWLTRRLHGRTRTAALLTVFVLLLGVAAPLATLGGIVAQRVVVEAAEVARSFKTDGVGSLTRVADRLGPLGPPLKRALADVGPRLQAALPEVAQRAAQVVATIGGAIVQLVTGAFLLAISLYYFLIEGQRWRARFVRVFPMPAADLRLFLERYRQVSLAVFVGNLGTAVGQGVTATIGYLIFGTPVPVLWGVITILAALVPLVGSGLVWVPLSVVLAVEGHMGRGIGLALFGIFGIGGVDNILRPLLTKRGLRLHPLLTFIAIFGGIATWGFAGLFVGPLVIALFVTILDLWERRTNQGPPPDLSTQPAEDAPAADEHPPLPH